MLKPSGCLGCPMFDDGDGFTPDEVVPGAQADVWLQNISEAGDDLNDKFLPEAGLARGSDVNVRSVIRCKWRHPVTGRKTSLLPSGKVLEKAIAHCRVHDTDTGAKIAIACGKLPWKAFGGPGTVTEWRGFLKPHA